MKKPLILVTNDDGLFAPGIKALVEVMKEIGEVVIVAPDSPQSAQGHSITIEHPIFLNEVDFMNGVDAYECSGTPVDCVKLALNVVLKGRKPDLCVSGINHGSNAAINIIYSGTMSAAMEASIIGIPSIGFSLLDFSFKANFAPVKPYVKQIAEHVLENGLQDTNLLNVNFPKLPFEDIKGIKVCCQAEARWQEEFQEGINPRGQKYYWLKGVFTNNDTRMTTDVEALENGYVSIVPCMHDLTMHGAIDSLKNVW